MARGTEIKEVYFDVVLDWKYFFLLCNCHEKVNLKLKKGTSNWTMTSAEVFLGKKLKDQQIHLPKMSH